jgi:hypothetical protein
MGIENPLISSFPPLKKGNITEATFVYKGIRIGPIRVALTKFEPLRLTVKRRNI